MTGADDAAAGASTMRDSRCAGSSPVGIDAAASRPTASRHGIPGDTPSAAAFALANEITPRASVSAASAIRADVCATAAAAMPACSSATTPAMPASSSPRPASLKIAARTPAEIA